jgi:hypothetical protein
VPGVEGSRFNKNRYTNVVRLAPATFTPQKIFMLLTSVRGCVDCIGHSAAGRIMSMKNSNDIIENRTRDLPVCSAVPQPTAPPCAPLRRVLLENVRDTVAYLMVKFLFSVKREGSEGTTTTRNQSRYFRCYPWHNGLFRTLIYPRSLIYRRYVLRKSTTTITYVPKI